MNMKTNLALVLLAAFALAACDKAARNAKTSAVPPAAGEHGHDHAPGGEKITHFTDRTELFVEFPHLVAGEKTAFAAHLTDLRDFQALKAGRVTVRLSGGGAEEAFSVDQAAQPGIFRPEAAPKVAGERELSIEVATPEFTVRHELGPVTVYANRKAAEGAPAAQESGGIGFTKEQQWKVDWATAEVAKRTMRASFPATATVRAPSDGEAQLTAPVAGQVQAAANFPRLGEAVGKGQVLAHLVPRLGGEVDAASLESGARKAQVAFEQARRERERLEALYKQEAVAEKRVDAARAEEESARAELTAAQRRVGQYSGGGGGIPVRSPIGGRVADVRVSPGAFAAEGALLFHIVDPRRLWIEARVPEVHAARLAAVSGVAVRVEGVERAIEIVPGRNGRIVGAGGVVDPVTRTVPVIFELAGEQPALKVGMAAAAEVFAGSPRESIAVPASAVVDDNGLPVVFVQSGGESFERRPVRVGARQGDWVEIVDGLEAGRRVVTRGAYLVKLAAAKTGEIGHGHAH